MDNTMMTNDAAQSRKLHDLGSRLTCVAHEINVPLSLIVGSLDTLAQYTDVLADYAQSAHHVGPEDSHHTALPAVPNIAYIAANTPSLIAICREGTQRLQHIVGQLRTYSQRGGASSERIDVCRVIEASVRLAAHGQDVVPQVEIAALPKIRGSADALGQALVNLISNAIDAVADRAAAQVTIDARLEAGDVVIVVRDNGPGVPADIAPRIFEPFFTTKSRRSGLGLGLAIVHEIITDLGGTIKLGHPNVGAEFVVRLPPEAL